MGFDTSNETAVCDTLRTPMRSTVLTLFTLLRVADFLRLPQQGSICDGDCPNGLVCTCLALNRGLRVCEPPGISDSHKGSVGGSDEVEVTVDVPCISPWSIFQRTLALFVEP